MTTRHDLDLSQVIMGMAVIEVKDGVVARFALCDSALQATLAVPLLPVLPPKRMDTQMELRCTLSSRHS